MKVFGGFVVLAAAFALSPIGCTSDGLIGGDCATGYGFCDGQCTSLSEDEKNCGACNNACPRRLACLESLCGGPSGMVTVDDLPMGGSSSGGAGTGGVGGINVGAGGPGGNDGTGSAGACLPPYDTASACGDCNTACTGATPNCVPDGGSSYECVENCLTDPYTTQCGGQCVDVETNSRHCGKCNNPCVSGICIDGSCIGATSGHQIAMCMSFESYSAGQTNLLANSVFLASGNPVRILAYTADTSSVSLLGTDLALTNAAKQKGRAYSIDKVTTSSAVTSQLNRSNFEVFLVYDQQGASAGELAGLGTAWKTVVDDFSKTGGVVIFLSGGGGRSEMHELISNVGMFNTAGTTNHTGKGNWFYVEAPGDAVGINVISPFFAEKTSCLFDTSDPASGNLVHVVTGPTPDKTPSVLHKIVSP